MRLLTSYTLSQGLRTFIRQAFAHLVVIAPIVNRDEYVLFGPDGTFLDDSSTETQIQPGWKIKMIIWVTPNMIPLPDFGEPLDISILDGLESSIITNFDPPLPPDQDCSLRNDSPRYAWYWPLDSIIDRTSTEDPSLEYTPWEKYDSRLELLAIHAGDARLKTKRPILNEVPEFCWSGYADSIFDLVEPGDTRVIDAEHVANYRNALPGNPATANFEGPVDRNSLIQQATSLGWGKQANHQVIKSSWGNSYSQKSKKNREHKPPSRQASPLDLDNKVKFSERGRSTPSNGYNSRSTTRTTTRVSEASKWNKAITRTPRSLEEAPAQATMSRTRKRQSRSKDQEKHVRRAVVGNDANQIAAYSNDHHENADTATAHTRQTQQLV